MSLVKRVDLAGVAIEQTTGAPIALLREQDEPHRLLPIFIGGLEAASIAAAVSGPVSARPLTHDLMATLLDTLDARVETAEVTELRDGAFLARLTVTGAHGEHQLDTRPSDAIALAVRLGAPLLVSEAVLDEAGSRPDAPMDDAELDPADIDQVVGEFRSFLDDIDPAQFELEPPPPTSDVEDDPANDPPVGEADG